MVVGRLVSHACGTRWVGRCVRCNRSMCGAHLAEQQVCVQCHGRYQPPDGILSSTGGALLEFGDDDASAFDDGASPGDDVGDDDHGGGGGASEDS